MATVVHLDRVSGRATVTVYDGTGRLRARYECETRSLELRVRGGATVRLPATVSQDYVVLVVEGEAAPRCGPQLVLELGGRGAHGPAEGGEEQEQDGQARG